MNEPRNYGKEILAEILERKLLKRWICHNMNELFLDELCVGLHEAGWMLTPLVYKLPPPQKGTHYRECGHWSLCETMAQALGQTYEQHVDEFMAADDWNRDVWNRS